MRRGEGVGGLHTDSSSGGQDRRGLKRREAGLGPAQRWLDSRGQSCSQFGKISQPISLEQWNEVNFWDSIRHAALRQTASLGVMLLFWKDWAQRYNWTGEIKLVSAVLVGLSDSKWGHRPLYFLSLLAVQLFWKTGVKRKRQRVCPFFHFYSPLSLSSSLVSLCPPAPASAFLLDFTICFKFFSFFFFHLRLQLWLTLS